MSIPTERSRCGSAARGAALDDYDGDRLHPRGDGKRLATPLLAALVMVAAFDVMFAIDSIPAIFAITRDTFVVFAANAFSLLGMVSLFFLLDGMLDRFRYLNVGLAAILGFVAAKLLLVDVWHPPIALSLAAIVPRSQARRSRRSSQSGVTRAAAAAPPAGEPPAVESRSDGREAERLGDRRLTAVARREPDRLALVGELRDRDRGERDVQCVERAQSVLAGDGERLRLDLPGGGVDDVDRPPGRRSASRSASARLLARPVAGRAPRGRSLQILRCESSARCTWRSCNRRATAAPASEPSSSRRYARARTDEST